MIGWLNDQTLVVSRSAERLTHQLWTVAYPEGTLARLSNDLNGYDGVSLTADGSSLVTARSERRVSIWIGNRSNWSRKAEIATAPIRVPIFRLVWAGDMLMYPAGSADGGMARLMASGARTGEIALPGGVAAASATWTDRLSCSYR